MKLQIWEKWSFDFSSLCSYHEKFKGKKITWKNLSLQILRLCEWGSSRMEGRDHERSYPERVKPLFRDISAEEWGRCTRMALWASNSDIASIFLLVAEKDPLSPTASVGQTLWGHAMILCSVRKYLETPQAGCFCTHAVSKVVFNTFKSLYRSSWSSVILRKMVYNRKRY